MTNRFHYALSSVFLHSWNNYHRCKPKKKPTISKTYEVRKVSSFLKTSRLLRRCICSATVRLNLLLPRIRLILHWKLIWVYTLVIDITCDYLDDSKTFEVEFCNRYLDHIALTDSLCCRGLNTFYQCCGPNLSNLVDQAISNYKFLLALLFTCFR